jgi:hypothetical protein
VLLPSLPLLTLLVLPPLTPTVFLPQSGCKLILDRSVPALPFYSFTWASCGGRRSARFHNPSGTRREEMPAAKTDLSPVTNTPFFWEKLAPRVYTVPYAVTCLHSPVFFFARHRATQQPRSSSTALNLFYTVALSGGMWVSLNNLGTPSQRAQIHLPGPSPPPGHNLKRSARGPPLGASR